MRNSDILTSWERVKKINENVVILNTINENGLDEHPTVIKIKSL